MSALVVVAGIATFDGPAAAGVAGAGTNPGTASSGVVPRTMPSAAGADADDRPASVTEVSRTPANAAGAAAQRAILLSVQGQAVARQGIVLQADRAAARSQAEVAALRAKAKAARTSEAAAVARAEAAAAARVHAEATTRTESVAVGRPPEPKGPVPAQPATGSGDGVAGAGDPREIARRMLSADYSYGPEQYACLNFIIMRESGWSVTATNARSGAYGIPQALPGSKMASIAADWRTNPATQIRWAIEYIKDRYGSPCQAKQFKAANGWY